MRDFFYWQRLQFRQEKVAYTYSIRRRSKVRISNHSKRYIAHTIFDISIFDMMGAAFPETFPFLSSYTLHIHFLFSFFCVCLLLLQHFLFFLQARRRNILFFAIRITFLTNFSSSSTTASLNFWSWIFFSRRGSKSIAIYLWKIFLFKEIKINFDRVMRERTKKMLKSSTTSRAFFCENV